MNDALLHLNPYLQELGIDSRDDSPSYYRLLNLVPAPGLGVIEVRDAARVVRQRLKNLGEPEHPQQFQTVSQMIDDAEKCLADADRRRAYDLQLDCQQMLRPATRQEFLDRGENFASAARSVGTPVTAASPKSRFAWKQPGSEKPAEVLESTEFVAAAVESKSVPDKIGPSDPRPVPSSKGRSNYEILREIGRGRSSVVFEAYESALRRYVAIKELDGKLLADRRQTELFWKEARFLAGLRHDNIVSVYAVDVQRNWIVMERMKGNVAMRHSQGPLAPELVRSILRQALLGLEYLHEQRKLHGEIKPSSLLLDAQGRVKLSDSPGFAIGGEIRVPPESQRHVAPELLNPEVFGRAGPAVDLYCLGYTALELLVGPEFPHEFKGIVRGDPNNRLAWMRWHSSASESLPPAKELVPSAPDDLVLVIDRMVNKFVDQRYPSARAVLEDLEERPLVLVQLPEQPEQRPTESPSKGETSVSAAPRVAPKRPTKPTAPEDLAHWAKQSGAAVGQAARRHPHISIVIGTALVALLLLALLGEREDGRDDFVVDQSTPTATVMPPAPLIPREVPDRFDSPSPSPPANDRPVADPRDKGWPGGTPADSGPPKDISTVEGSPGGNPTAHGSPEVPELPMPTTRDPQPVVIPVPQRPRSIRDVATRWDLPADLTPEQQNQYVRLVQLLLETRNEPRSLRDAKASEIFKEAHRICDRDGRLYDALSIVLLTKCSPRDTKRAVTLQLENFYDNQPHRQSQS